MPEEAGWLEWKCRLQAISYRPDARSTTNISKPGADGRAAEGARDRREDEGRRGEPLRSQFNAWKRSVHRRVEAEPVLMMRRSSIGPQRSIRRAGPRLELFDVVAEQNRRCA